MRTRPKLARSGLVLPSPFSLSTVRYTTLTWPTYAQATSCQRLLKTSRVSTTRSRFKLKPTPPSPLMSPLNASPTWIWTRRRTHNHRLPRLCRQRHLQWKPRRIRTQSRLLQRRLTYLHRPPIRISPGRPEGVATDHLAAVVPAPPSALPATNDNPQPATRNPDNKRVLWPDQPRRGKNQRSRTTTTE